MNTTTATPSTTPLTIKFVPNALHFGLQFFNERNAFFSETDWSDDDDEHHPWGGDDSIDPFDQDWTVQNAAWDDDLLEGILHWDHLLSEGLNPVRLFRYISM